MNPKFASYQPQSTATHLDYMISINKIALDLVTT